MEAKPTLHQNGFTENQKKEKIAFALGTSHTRRKREGSKEYMTNIEERLHFCSVWMGLKMEVTAQTSDWLKKALLYKRILGSSHTKQWWSRKRKRSKNKVQTSKKKFAFIRCKWALRFIYTRAKATSLPDEFIENAMDCLHQEATKI